MPFSEQVAIISPSSPHFTRCSAAAAHFGMQVVSRVGPNLSLVWQAAQWVTRGLNCASSTLQTVNRQLCSDLEIAQQAENYVAETITPLQHRESEHPDVSLQGSLRSSSLYGAAVNSLQFHLISHCYYLYKSSLPLSLSFLLSASHLKVIQHKSWNVFSQIWKCPHCIWWKQYKK